MKKCIKTDNTVFFWGCGLLALLNLLVMLRIGGKVSLWSDEVAQIGYINKSLSFPGIIQVYLKTEVTNLPFFPLIAAIWYRICPWGEKWLYVVTEIPVVIGIFVCGLAGKEWKDQKTGLLTAAFAATSYYLIVDGGLNFRAYAFTFCFAALTIWLYIRRFRDMGNETWKSQLLLGLAMTGFAYSNYFGCILIVALFIGDFILYIGKKIRISCIIPYLMSGGLLAPWFVCMLFNKRKTLTEFWPKPPTLISIPKLFLYIASDQQAVMFLLVAAMLLVCIKALFAIYNDSYSTKEDGIGLISLFVIWFTIILVFIYSAKINPGGGIFVKRYFMTIFPLAYLLMADALGTLTDWMIQKENQRTLFIALLIGIQVFYFGLMNFYQAKEKRNISRDPYREASEWLAEQDKLYDPDTCVMVWESNYYYAGFKDYYISHSCDTDSMNIMNYGEEDWEEKLSQYDRVYLIAASYQPGEEKLSCLESYEITNYNEEFGIYEYQKKN